MRKRISVLVCFGLLFLFPIVLSAQEIMPLKDVKPGMKGYGSTVYEDFKIERFETEIIGTVYFWIGSAETPVILAKLSGGPIGYPMDKTKVVAGMSGSPVYIDGKLIGAVAYRFGTIPLDAIAGISPIELMLNPYTNKAGLPSGEQLKMLANQSLNPIPLVLKMPSPFVSFLKEKFSQYSPVDFNALNQNFIFSSASQTASESQGNFPPLTPGSALSVSLIKGDINWAAAGTVTTIDRDKIYAFGHPFYNLGRVNYPFYPVRILTTFSDLAGSFKIAAEEGEKELGVIENDYYTAISGTLGKKAQMIPFEINLSGDRGEKEINCQIVRAPELTYLLIKILGLYAMYDGYKEVNSNKASLEQSLSIETKMEFKDLPTLKLHHIYDFQLRDWEPKLGGPSFISQYLKMLDNLIENFSKKISVDKHKSIAFQFKFTDKKEPFRVEKITTDKDVYRPGETVSISAVLSRMEGNKKEWYQLKNGVKIPVPVNIRLAKDGTVAVEVEVSSGEEMFSGLPFVDKQVDAVKLIETLNHLSNTQLWLKVTFPIVNYDVYLTSFLNWLKTLPLIDIFLKDRTDSSEWVKFKPLDDEQVILLRLPLPEGAMVSGNADLDIAIGDIATNKATKRGKK